MAKAKKIKYRKLWDGVYQLVEDYEIQLDIKIIKDYVIPGWAHLYSDGLLIIEKWVVWDGPSGLTIDGKNNLRPSLIHDELYKLMRVAGLPKSFRKYVDDLFKKQLREDGMSRARSFYWHRFVRALGWKFVKPNKDELKTRTAP